MNQTTAADGLELFYRVQRCGNGPSPAMLLVHGAASNHTRWSEFARNTCLSKRFDLIMPDMRGNARSMCRGRIGLDTWCKDLVAILGAENQDSAIVVGHSLGAQVALHLAASYPRRVRALALIDPVVREALVGRPRRLKRMEPLVKVAILVLRALNRLGLQRRRFPLMDLEELDAETRESLEGDDPREFLVRRYSGIGLILEYMPIANYLQQLVATISRLPRLECVTVPTLVIESTGVQEMDRAKSRIELARLPALERVDIDATHWPLTERPDEVRRAIESWVERITADDPSRTQA